MKNELVAKAMTIKLDNTLPEYPKMEEGYRRAPDRGFRLTLAQAELALRNALRYVPEELHETLAPNSWKNSKPAAESMPIAIVPREGFTANPSMNTRANASKARLFRS